MSASEDSLRKMKEAAVRLTLGGRPADGFNMARLALESAENSDLEPCKKAAWISAFHTISGGAQMALKNFEEALADYKKALEAKTGFPVDSSFAFAYDNLSKAYEALDLVHEAANHKIAALEILQKFSPESSALVATKYREAADCMDRLGRCAEAEELRSRADGLCE